jgi:hypothetical protein
MVYSRIIDVASCLVDPGDGSNAWQFEPGKVLTNLAIDWTKLQCPLVVTISDDSQSVEYNLDTFMSKTYRTDGKIIKFGVKRFSINSLRFTVGWKIMVEDITPTTGFELD